MGSSCCQWWSWTSGRLRANRAHCQPRFSLPATASGDNHDEKSPSWDPLPTARINPALLVNIVILCIHRFSPQTPVRPAGALLFRHRRHRRRGLCDEVALQSGRGLVSFRRLLLNRTVSASSFGQVVSF